MKNIFAILCLLACTPAVQAISSNDIAVAAPDPTALTNDEIGSPDAIVNTFYQLLSGDAGQRNWSKMRALCLPKAQFNAVRINSSGKKVNRFGSIDDYIKNTNTFFVKNQFYNQETDRKIADFGDIATVFSGYNAQINYSNSGKQLQETGLITFQLVRARDRWYISSVFWNTGQAPDLSAAPSTTAPTSNATTTTALSGPATTQAPGTYDPAEAAPTNTYDPEERVAPERKIRFEAGVDGEIFNETEVDAAANFGENDASIFRYLGENVTLPADDSGKGTYQVEFIVDKEGWCNNVKVYESKSNFVVNEFVKAFSSMPKWTPAKKGGKAVNCRITLSLNLN
jgi:hypothetical protein